MKIRQFSKDDQTAAFIVELTVGLCVGKRGDPVAYPDISALRTAATVAMRAVLKTTHPGLAVIPYVPTDPFPDHFIAKGSECAALDEIAQAALLVRGCDLRREDLRRYDLRLLVTRIEGAACDAEWVRPIRKRKKTRKGRK